MNIEIIDNEIKSLTLILRRQSSEYLQKFYLGKLQGLKLGQMLVSQFIEEEKVFLWGTKLLSITQDDSWIPAKRVKFIIKNLIKNNRRALESVNRKNIDSCMRPLLNGHTNGLETVVECLCIKSDILVLNHT